MAGSICKVILIGNLGKDPEVRTMTSGDKVCNFSLATSITWKDKQGEKQEKTTWHNIVVWNKGLVNVCESYLKKGSKVYIEGTIENRSYEKDGQTKYISEIVLRDYGSTLTMLDSRKDGPSAHDTAKADGYQPQPEVEDEIPL